MPSSRPRRRRPSTFACPCRASTSLGCYLLTGETRSQVGVVKPHHPFTLRKGEYGLGAWEVFARYDYIDIGSSIYEYGLASTTGNANRVWQTDIGVNWWMTQYVKMVFTWHHDEFNNAVTYRPRQVLLDHQHAVVAVPALLLMRMTSTRDELPAARPATCS